MFCVATITATIRITSASTMITASSMTVTVLSPSALPFLVLVLLRVPRSQNSGFFAMCPSGWDCHDVWETVMSSVFLCPFYGCW